MFTLIPQSPLCCLVAATLFVPPLFSVSCIPSRCNNHHPVVLLLSVNCEQILMSPQFYSALAAFACHLPACKDTQLAIIPSLSPPWLITVLFLSLLLSFSHLSCYFLIFLCLLEKKVHSQPFFSLFGNLTPLCYFLFFIILCLCFSNSKAVNLSLSLFLAQGAIYTLYVFTQIQHLFTQSGPFLQSLQQLIITIQWENHYIAAT